MSLRPFLDHLAASPDEMRQFFLHARSTMLRVLGYKFPKIPHQMLEDAVMQAFKQMMRIFEPDRRDTQSCGGEQLLQLHKNSLDLDD